MDRRAAILLVALALPACLDPFAPDVGPPIVAPTCDADLSPSIATSFATDVSPILRRACDRCHLPGGSGVQQSGLDVSTYATLRAGGTRSGVGIVVDGMPCESVLWQKLGATPPFGARMPRGSTPLSDADRALIHDWIAEGARDD